MDLGLSVGGYARPAAAAAGAGPGHGAPAGLIQHHVHEMKIPNDLIGCIIGRGGSKINEIRSFLIYLRSPTLSLDVFKRYLKSYLLARC